MALHYHGLPLTPFDNLLLLEGKNVCISFATAYKSNVKWALAHAQSIMWDNGAFSAFTRGVPFKERAYYDWVAPNLGHPHWGVVPDVIGGTVEEQRLLVARWPFTKQLGAPVWHLHLPLDYLLELTDEWPQVCLGSSAQFWKVGAPEWQHRMDETFDYLLAHRMGIPRLHGLRMLSQLGKRWPLASADSVNVARNYNNGVTRKCPACMSHRIDMVNGPIKWTKAIPTCLADLVGEDYVP